MIAIYFFIVLIANNEQYVYYYGGWAPASASLELSNCLLPWQHVPKGTKLTACALWLSLEWLKEEQ